MPPAGYAKFEHWAPQDELQNGRGRVWAVL